MALDDKDFDGYIGLCDPEYQYRITAYSPEIRKEMTWLEHDRKGMKTLFANLPRHNSDQSLLTRNVSVCTVSLVDGGRRAQTVSTIQAYRTLLDGGITELFAVGRLYDLVAMNEAGPQLLERTVRLDTRMLGYGFHIPI